MGKAKKTARKFAPVAGLVVLAVLALAAAGFALLRPPTQAPVSDAVAHYTPAPQPTVQKVPVAVFVGDSYTAGARASVPALRWSSLVAKRLGWAESNLARGGTGYIATSGMVGCGLEFCPNYAGMMGEVVAAKPDVVVVSGGRNDVTQNSGIINESVTAYFASLRKALPDATIVAISPVWDSSHAPAILADITAAVKAQTAAVGGKYLDIGQPLAGKRELIDADGVHPDDQGYAVLAEAVTAAAAGAQLPVTK